MKPNMRRKPKKCLANYNLLKTSWKYQAKIFFEESTLHGVRYIAEKGRPLVEKLMWFVCVVIGAIATMVIIVSLWEKFQTNPTITGLDTDFHTWDVPFPAITICQSLPSNLSIIEEYIENNMNDIEDKELATDFLLKLTKLNYFNLEDFKEFTNSKLISNDVDLKKYIFELMNPCESVFSTCIFKSEAYNCCDSFFPIFTERGFCYTFNSRHYEKYVPGIEGAVPDFKMRYIKETDAKWSLKFTVENILDQTNISIFIHNSDEVPGIDVKPQHVWNFKVERMLFSVKQTYTMDDAKQLSIRQRHCVFEHERELKVDNIYTYTGCTQQCRMDTSMRLCGCIPHFYNENERYNFRHCRLDQLSCIVDNLEQIGSVENCNCQLGCSNTVYEVEKLNENTETTTNQLEAEFVSWPMVRYKREVLFGWVDLLVSFGGIAGLFLGFSLLSGVEVIYYFTIRACCMVYKERDDLKKIREEDLQKKKATYDLSLVPYFIKKPKPDQAIGEVMMRNRKFITFPSKLETINVKPLEAKKIAPPFGINYIN